MIPRSILSSAADVTCLRTGGAVSPRRPACLRSGRRSCCSGAPRPARRAARLRAADARRRRPRATRPRRRSAAAPRAPPRARPPAPSALPTGWSSCTRPIASAVGPSIFFARRIMSSACARPTVRVSRAVPPHAGTVPRSSSGSPMRAPSVAARRKWHASGSSSPPPRQYPNIVAITGLSSCSIIDSTRSRWSSTASNPPRACAPDISCLRSIPTLKCSSPAAVITTARASRSSRSAITARSSSSMYSNVIRFRGGSWFSRITTAPATLDAQGRLGHRVALLTRAIERTWRTPVCRYVSYTIGEGADQECSICT